MGLLRARRSIALLLVLFGSSCRGGCARRPDATRPVGGALAVVPAEAQYVLAIDFARIRETSLWQKASQLAGQDPRDRRLIEELTARTGLDPWTQIHRVVAAFPGEARGSGQFALVFEGTGFDEKRLVTYARDKAKLAGAEIAPRTHGARTLGAPSDAGPAAPSNAGPAAPSNAGPAASSNAGPAAPSAAGPAGVFLGPDRFVLGAGGWAEKVLDLVDGAPGAASAEGNATLARLGDRIGPGRSFWLLANVPEATRKALLNDPRMGVQASVLRLAVGADLGPGLAGELVAELSNAADAQALAAKVETFLKEARRSPQALLVGAGPYLDAVSTEVQGPTVRVRVALTPVQTEDLVARLVGLLRLARSRVPEPPPTK